MENLILSPVPLNELLEQFRLIIKQEIKAEQQALQKEALLSPGETCKIFVPAISKNTLAAWTAAGSLKRYDIGGRVYYRYSEVLEAAKSLQRYKRPV